jgi:sugar O-acyltransferase (sialic acid O-acetyltransferase NeuD family)
MRLAIFGAGRFGREVAPLALRGGATNDVVFVVSEPTERQVNGVPVLAFDELLSPAHRDRRVFIAIANPADRRQIASECDAAALQFSSIIASSHVGFDYSTVGDGTVFCDFTMLLCNSTVGKHFHCNVYSYVGHDCTIGDYVTFAPRVSLNGWTVVEDDVYIGTGAVFREGTPENPLRIGKGAVIGMGAVVTKSVPSGVTVVGNPARPLVK